MFQQKSVKKSSRLSLDDFFIWIRFDPTPSLMRLDSCDANKTVYDCRVVQVLWVAGDDTCDDTCAKYTGHVGCSGSTWKINILNLQITHEKERNMIWTFHLHEGMFQPLIFRGVCWNDLAQLIQHQQELLRSAPLRVFRCFWVYLVNESWEPAGKYMHDFSRFIFPLGNEGIPVSSVFLV